MPELLLIIKDFNTNNPNLVTWAVASLLVVFGLISQAFWIKECIAEYKLRHLLKNVGTESLHNVTIPDGIDGKIFIENLILLPSKILLLGVKKYRGLIFAAEKIDLWTQVIGNKSYKFENPLRQLESVVLALNSQIENTKIAEKVLFINGSEFPKGKPEKIITIGDLKKLTCRYTPADIPDPLRKNWQHLLDMADRHDFNKENGVLIDDEDTSGLNVFSLLTIIIILTVWLGWRLM